MFATGTPPELQALIDRIEAEGGGKAIGEQMLADAHGWDAENDRPNRSD